MSGPGDRKLDLTERSDERLHIEGRVSPVHPTRGRTIQNKTDRQTGTQTDTQTNEE